MKFTQLNTPNTEEKSSTIYRFLTVLAIFGIVGSSVSFYILSRQQAPEVSQAAETHLCAQGIYDNFDKEKLNKEIWEASAHYQVNIENGRMRRLLDDKNWAEIYTNLQFAGDFVLEAEIYNLKYQNQGEARIIAKSKDGRNIFYVGQLNDGYIASSFLDNENQGVFKNSFRQGLARSVKLERKGNLVKFMYIDNNGTYEIGTLPAFTGDVQVGISTGSEQRDNFVTAEFDNFQLSCPV